MIETGHRYKYYRQENGNYTIFNVPIFAVTSQGDGREVSIQNLQNIVQKMQSEKERGWYARLIIGHQSDEDYSTNAPGAGYIDNYSVNEKEGILYADYVEVPPQRFSELQCDKYPGRSCEYRPEEELIESLALLESRTPYFRFPVFRLGEEVSEVSRYTRESALVRFQSISNSNSLGAGINPGEKPKKEDYVTTKAKRRLRRSKRDLEKKLAELKKKYAYQEEKETAAAPAQAPQPAPAPQPTPEAQPTAVAPAEESTEEFSSEREYIDSCMKYMQECMQKLEAFMSNDEQPSQLDPLAMQDDKKARRYAKNISRSAKNIARNYDFKKGNKSIVSKYSRESEEVRGVAMQASKDWEDTVGQEDRRAAEKFQVRFPSKESFVEKAVEQEKASRGSYNAIYHG